MMKAIICGGGSGGHVYPAVAIGEIINNEFDQSEIVYIGREGGDENRGYLSTGMPLYTLKVSGINRSLSPKNILSLARAFLARRKAISILKKLKPDIVIGTGGYVSWPVLSAALALKLPTLIHESNAYPGLVTRLIGHKCKAIMLGSRAANEHLPKAKNIFYTGTPIRGELGTLTRELARAKLGIKKDERLILSFGGSLGAARMNEAIIDFMKKYSLSKKKIKHIHGCGAIYFKELLEKYPTLANGVNGCQIVEYIDRMPLYMKAADLAITRSGAITLSELREAGTPSILIPSPNVSDNHQLKNAEELSALGGAVVITEDKLSCAELIDTVGSIIESGPTLHKMRGALERTKPINTGTIISEVIKNALTK